ncbi:MAG: ABC transporter substrate-binding protein [Spirochaetia bacterium]|jgi:putative ABC transport system substrate-binding protein|nr:ABC transporter substrate-binding protein [Spirochaetia bacterium]
MKKIVLISLVLFITLSLSVFAAGQKEEKTVIGISKIVAHPALDAVEQGIQDELAAQGFVDVEYDLQNANGEVTTAASIATKFKSSGVTVAVGIATPTAQALINSLKDIPVVYSAVTDPVAAGMITSFDKGEKGVAGVSDLTPVKEQIMMLQRITGLKRLGHIYSSGEANAVILAEMAEKACAELGIEFVVSTVTNSSEVKQAAQAIINKVDGIYVSTDNTVVSALASLADVAMKAGVPIMSADPSSTEGSDVLIAWGFDYYKVGRATGRVVADILNGKSTEDMPTVFMTESSDINLVINLDVAEKLGITIPADLLEIASK